MLIHVKMADMTYLNIDVCLCRGKLKLYLVVVFFFLWGGGFKVSRNASRGDHIYHGQEELKHFSGLRVWSE